MQKWGGGYFLRNTNKRKGFTLIELLAVIVILSVIAVIATPIILNIVNDARKSAVKDSIFGYIEAIENEVALSYLEDEEYKDNEEYGYDEIKVDVKGIRPTGGLYTLKDGIVTNGTFCIDGYTVNYENNEVEVGNKGCNEEELKLNGSIKLSSTSGNYTYPETKEIEVIENISRGTLSCETEDEEIATCSIKDNIVTVKSGTKEGSATLTITSSSTSKYKKASAAYVVITAKETLTSYTANGYTGIYDSKEHGITVESSGSTITYGIDGTNYSSENPKYIDVGEYTVYYKIETEGYNDVTGSKKVLIKKAAGSVNAPTAKALTYTGSSQTLINAGSSNTGTIEYKLGSGTYSEVLPEATNAGTYTIYYRVVGDKNHKDVDEQSISVTIGKAAGSVTAPTAKTLYYTGSNQKLINAGSSNTGTIQYKLAGGTYSTSIPEASTVGTHTVYYKVVGDSNHKDVTEASISVTIKKASNILKLSANTGDYTYPNGGEFTVTSNTSGGALSCSSDKPNVATCTVSGNTVTVKLETEPSKGPATLTITSAETDNYEKGQTAYVVNTTPGICSITANGYEGNQDGKAHGITVSSSNCGTIKYGTSSGTYNLTSSPTYTAVGTKTVYYQVSHTGYTTVTGSKQVIIKDEIITAPVKTTTYANSSTIEAWFSSGSAGSGIKSTACYRTDSSGNVLATGTLSNNNCTFSGLSASTTYYYKKCITTNAGNTKCSSVSCIKTAGDVFDYGYTGGEQVLTLPYKASLILYVWGAQGSSYYSTGGYGGYSDGRIYVDTTKLYINIGGQPTSTEAGYNGGATGLIDQSSGVYKAGGGGATHIATVSGKLRELSSYRDKILIVAGGGGGSARYVTSFPGGHGGGALGGTPTCNDFPSGAVYRSVNYGASQVDGGRPSNDLYSTTVYVANGDFGIARESGGGGGGFYGAPYMYTGARVYSGAGGSGYIGNPNLRDKSMYAYDEGCAPFGSSDPTIYTICTTGVSASPTLGYAKAGHGYAHIVVEKYVD